MDLIKAAEPPMSKAPQKWSPSAKKEPIILHLIPSWRLHQNFFDTPRFSIFDSTSPLLMGTRNLPSPFTRPVSLFRPDQIIHFCGTTNFLHLYSTNQNNTPKNRRLTLMKIKIRPIRNIMKTRLHAIRASYGFLSCLALGIMTSLSTQTSFGAAGPLVQSVTPVLTLEHVRVAFFRSEEDTSEL